MNNGLIIVINECARRMIFIHGLSVIKEGTMVYIVIGRNEQHKDCCYKVSIKLGMLSDYYVSDWEVIYESNHYSEKRNCD